MPGRFSAALAQAGKLLEPKLQQVRLSSSVIKNEEELKEWFRQKEEELTSKLKVGPIVIG